MSSLAVQHGYRNERVLTAYLFVLLTLFLLAPYFNLGVAVNGGLVAVVLIAVLTPSSVRDLARQRWFYQYALLFVALGAYSGLMASLYGAESFSFLKVMISLSIYMAAGFSIGRLLLSKGFAAEDALIVLLRLTLGMVVLNSVVVLVSFLVPEVKGAIESALADASNIDYKSHEFKLRGLASAGGASLSVMHALGVWIALALYRERLIGVLSLMFSCSAIAAAMLFIGRTGYVLIGLALFMHVFTTTSARRLWQLLVGAAALGACVAIGWEFIANMLPPEIQKYSVLFLFQGTEGLRREGTLETLSRELFLPDSMVHLLFGIGYYNGENILHRTPDPGYMKSLLSLGLPLAVLLYSSCVYFLLPLLRSPGGRTYILPLVALLLVAEVKEPFFYSGYAARLLFMLGGAAYVLYAAERRGKAHSQAVGAFRQCAS